jgi:Ca2+/H+ antiporter
MADMTKRKWLISGGLLFIGSVLLLLVAHPFVVAIEELSLELGLSALILALIISPFDLPLPLTIRAYPPSIL